MHQLKKTITALLLVFSMVLSMATFALADQTGTVTADCVRIHTEASTESEVFQQANKGDKLTVLEAADENGWVKVSFTYSETGQTKTGYIAANYISTGDSSSSSDTQSSSEQKSETKSEKKQEQKAEESSEKKKESSSKKDDSSDKDASSDDSSKKESSSKDNSKKDSSKDSSKKESSSEKKDSSKEASKDESETATITSHISYTATVTDSGVRIRKKPSTDSDILTTVPEGDIVTVRSTEDEEGWMKVRYYDSEGKKYNGYMSGEYLDINTIGSGVSRVVNSIIRESPDNEAAIAGVVPINKVVDIYASDNNWYKIEYQDLSGWIHSDCIRAEGDSDCIGYGTVTTDGLNLREKTSTKSSSLTKIPEGVTFQITSEEKKGKWYAATFNGLSGYVSAEYVDRTDHCTKGYIQVTATSLSLRSGPGSDYTRLSTIPQGKVLKVEGSVGSWYQVTYDKLTGYVSGAFVSATTKDGFQAYPDYAEITASSLTLRSDASTDSDALSSIPKGTILAITGIYNGWYKVSYNGQTGYIDSGYVERSTEAAAAAAQAAQAAAAAQSAESAESGTTTTASSSGSGSSVLAYASQFVGNPYVWGGSSLTNGTDCSGFVKSVFAHFGVSLPHSSSAIRGYGKSVSYSDMQPGDVVCYSGHVGIYAGNGKLLSALGKKYGITYNSVNYKKILSIRRMN